MPVFFTDLDDTLFSTERKHIPGAALNPEAFLASGQPISYSCGVQRALRAWMSGPDCELIAVTARGTDAFKRTSIPVSSYAVCANGAVILTANGTPDLDWQHRMNTALEPHRRAMLDFRAELAKWALPLGLRTWLVEEPGLGPVYAVIKSPHEKVDLLAERAELLLRAPPEWAETIHHNDANLAVIPRGVSKRRAVEFLWHDRLRGEASAELSIGVGDSRSDWSFMSVCDFAVMPAKSQISKILSLAVLGETT